MNKDRGATSDSSSQSDDLPDPDDREAFNRLVEEIYPELKRFAHFQLLGERAGHTLSTTAIVHEAFLRMSESNPRWNDRAHFYRVAARVMRHLLVDHARRKRSAKRDHGVQPVDIEAVAAGSADDTVAVLAIDSAMQSIEDVDPRMARVIECRYFAGLSVQETADTLGIPLRTVQRIWQRARAYIRRSLIEDEQ